MKTNKKMLLSLILISAYTLIVGSPLLTDFPKGNDTPFHLTQIFYMEKNWPHIPQWCDWWGCGYPFLKTYPPASYYITFIIHKIFFISIFDSYKLISFASILFTALGIYFFMRITFENEVVALMSAILFLATPASWNFLSYIGRLPQQSAHLFFVFSLVFLALYQKGGNRKYIIAAIGCYALLFLSHTVIWAAGTLIIAAYALASVAFKKVSLGKAIVDVSSIIIGGLFLSGFWLFPFLQWISPRFSPTIPGGIPPPELGEFPDILDMLGVRVAFSPEPQPIIRLTPLLELLTLIGVVYALKKRSFSLFLLAISTVLFFFSLGLGPSSLYLWITPTRYIIYLCIFLSMLGGFGLANIIENLSARSNRRSAKTAIFLSLTLLVLVPTGVYMQIHESYAQKHLPVYQVAMEVLSYVDRTRDTRIMVSPYMGPLQESVNLIIDNPQVWAYGEVSPYFRNWMEYAGAVFDGRLGGKEAVKSLARWLAIEYFVLTMRFSVADHSVIIGENTLWKYEQTGFGKVIDEYILVPDVGFLALVRYSNATRTVVAADVPTVLMIGNQFAYDDIFRSTVIGGHDCDTAYILRGKEYIDDYSSEELKEFDAIVLDGYSYHDRERAWGLLEKYVREGGGLLIETGYSPDSNALYMPPPCPIERTNATEFGLKWHLTFVDNSITQGIDFGAFSPAVYNSSGKLYPWGVSASYDTSVREWANAILWDEGHPIVAMGDYGKGRVVWSGINLPYHVRTYENSMEGKFLLKMIDWVLGVPKPKKINHEVSRPIPERVEITVHNLGENTGVLFREAYDENWQATVIGSDGTYRELEIHRAGPDLMYVRMPNGLKTPLKVVFEFKPGLTSNLGNIVSMVTLCVLITYGFAPKIFDKICYPYKSLARTIKRILGRITKRLTGWWYRE